MSIGVLVGLIIGIYAMFIYTYKRLKKDNVKEVFIKNNCSDKNKIYIYWSLNSKGIKRGVPIFINQKPVGACRRGRLLVLDKPKRKFNISALFETHPSNFDIEYTNKPVLLVVDSTGTISEFKLETQGV